VAGLRQNLAGLLNPSLGSLSVLHRLKAETLATTEEMEPLAPPQRDGVPEWYRVGARFTDIHR